jgi:hypothetical protein
VSRLLDAARAAYVFGLPTVDLYRILHDFALDTSSPEYKGPVNTVVHNRRLADPADTSIVNLNVDTPYSYAWLDLLAEPMVLTMPATSEDRYMSAQVFDLYTCIVGCVSPRTHGHAGGSVVIAEPGWCGEAPSGMGVLRCPTELCLVMVRTQLFDDSDMANVAALQDQVSVRPLSSLTGRSPVATNPPLRPIAPVDVRTPPTTDFLRVLDWMLRLMPVLPEDRPVREVLAELHGALGSPDAAADIEAGLVAGMADLVARMRTVQSSGELFGSREFFAGDYLSRAAGAFLGILGNAAEEYLGVGYRADATGEPFVGTTRYAITFPPGGLPPVDAFWSITVYDAAQHLYENEIDRYVVSSRMVADLETDPDGSLTLQVQHEPPVAGNWLPCPAGPFGLTFRTYLPRAAIRDGAWTAPPVCALGPGR